MKKDYVEVSEHRMVKRIFGPEVQEVREGLRKLHNDEVSCFYCSPNIIRMIKSKTAGWSVYLASIAEKGTA
jgi:hypothetical protein